MDYNFTSQLEDLGVLTPSQIEEVDELAKSGSNIEVNTVVRKARPKIKQEFVITFIDNLQVLADLGLSSRQLKVMLYMLKAMEFGNIIMLSPKKMAEDLGIDKGNISRDLKELRNKNVLVEHEGHTYINSNIFVKGLKGGMSPEREKNLKAAQSTNGGLFKDGF